MFGAAHATGIAAGCGGSDVVCLTLAAPFGDFGLAGARRRPLHAVQQVLADAAGLQRRNVSAQGLVAVAWEAGPTISCLIANPGEAAGSLLLRAGKALLLTATADWDDTPAGALTLGPYRTALIHGLAP